MIKAFNINNIIFFQIKTPIILKFVFILVKNKNKNFLILK